MLKLLTRIDYGTLVVAMASNLRKAPATDPSTTSRWVWLLVMMLSAGIVSGLAGVLSHAAGNNVPSSVLTGVGAFAGTVGLLLAIAHYTRPQ
jgi:hypothetical protein